MDTLETQLTPEQQLIKDTFGTVPFGFKAAVGDANYKVHGPDPEKPGNWLLTVNYTGGSISRNRNAFKQKTFISKSFEEIESMSADGIANGVAAEMSTIGLATRDKQSMRRRTTRKVLTGPKPAPKKPMPPERLFMFRKIHEQVWARPPEHVTA